MSEFPYNRILDIRNSGFKATGKSLPVHLRRDDAKPRRPRPRHHEEVLRGEREGHQTHARPIHSGQARD